MTPQTVIPVVFALLLAAAVIVGYLAWKADVPLRAQERALKAARAQTPQPPEFVLAQNSVTGLWRAEQFARWTWDGERAVALYVILWTITPDANKQVIQDALDAREAARLEVNAWKQIEAFPSGQPITTTEDLF